MRRLEVTAEADRDLLALLSQSRENFGPGVQARYRRLVLRAYQDLRMSPDRPGVRSDGGAGGDLKIYHLRHSRARVPIAQRIGRPRHFIVFRSDGERLQIVRILHDAMDLAVHLDGEPA